MFVDFKGKSMFPFLRDGDKLHVETFSKVKSLNQFIEGDLVLTRQIDEFVVHRVVSIEGEVRLKGDHSKGLDIISQSSVFGLVKGLNRGGKVIYWGDQPVLSSWFAKASLLRLKKGPLSKAVVLWQIVINNLFLLSLKLRKINNFLIICYRLAFSKKFKTKELALASTHLYYNQPQQVQAYSNEEVQELELQLRDYHNKNKIKLQSILVVGCGVGRECSILKKWGYAVIGIDTSMQMIEAAKERYLDISFFHLSELNKIKSQFDCIFVSAGILNHLPSNQLRQQFIKKYKKFLYEQGFFWTQIDEKRRQESIKSIIISLILKLRWGAAREDGDGALSFFGKGTEREILYWARLSLKNLTQLDSDLYVGSVGDGIFILKKKLL